MPEMVHKSRDRRRCNDLTISRWARNVDTDEGEWWKVNIMFLVLFITIILLLSLESTVLFLNFSYFHQPILVLILFIFCSTGLDKHWEKLIYVLPVFKSNFCLVYFFLFFLHRSTISFKFLACFSSWVYLTTFFF